MRPRADDNHMRDLGCGRDAPPERPENPVLIANEILARYTHFAVRGRGRLAMDRMSGNGGRGPIMMGYEKLFGACRIAGLELKNRIVMAPMTRSRSPLGIPGEAVAQYYARRAAGGVGLIITEGTAIERPGSLDDPNVPRFHGNEALAGWREVVQAVHAVGGKIAPQLWHVGAFAGRNAAWVEHDQRIESPSGLRGPGDSFGLKMTDAAIADTIAAYARAAASAADLAFDGVEIHGAHGYLIDQYFWDGTNRRSDRYGGRTAAERSRFAAEVITAVRNAVPAGFPVIFRFSQFKQQDYGAKLAASPRELEQMLGPLADAGVDIFHASQRRFWEPEFEGSNLNLAGWASRVTGRPSITVGSVGLSGDYKSNTEGSASEPTSVDKLLDRLDRDEFDLVAVGRALLNDPEWALKIRDGRTAELRPFEYASLADYH